MTTSLLVELIGFLAAIVVFVSYLFSDQYRLRIVNIIASSLFIIYGFFLAAISGWINGWSTLALNTGCLIVHIVWIVKYKALKVQHHVRKRKPTDSDIED